MQLPLTKCLILFISVLLWTPLVFAEKEHHSQSHLYFQIPYVYEKFGTMPQSFESKHISPPLVLGMEFRSFTDKSAVGFLTDFHIEAPQFSVLPPFFGFVLGPTIHSGLILVALLLEVESHR